MATNLTLGGFLRERRTRLDPATLGLGGGYRRTPGLRREEVAQRAKISPTWYSWLEQGRGGPPSADALERLAAALVLTQAEREHLFLLGLGRTPEVGALEQTDVTPALQAVLDGLESSPALVRDAIWDVVAWNRAAIAIFTDYSNLPRSERNLLRLLFLDSGARASDPDWENIARIVVGIFRADVLRSGAAAKAGTLIDELTEKSAVFAEIWRGSEVQGACRGEKRLVHPELGNFSFHFSSFAVDGRSDLTMLVYTSRSIQDADRIKRIAARCAP